jgi:hypothetical protein
LEKLRESENDFNNNWISYSVDECYYEHTNLIDNY